VQTDPRGRVFHSGAGLGNVDGLSALATTKRLSEAGYSGRAVAAAVMAAADQRIEESTAFTKHEQARELLKLREGEIANGVPFTAARRGSRSMMR